MGYMLPMGTSGDVPSLVTIGEEIGETFELTEGRCSTTSVQLVLHT
jgi:hypothetical protein